MKIRILLLCLVMLPTLASAEIYKWKDKDGKVRYSDVPPPSNIPQESLYGKKIPKPNGQPPLMPVEGDATAAANKEKAAAKDKAPVNKEEAAAKRAKEAEQQKKEDEVKQADLKVKQENCKAAQANLRTYSVGGRLVKTNEKGEREYLGDTDIEKGKAEAQKDVEKYCDS
ncbi:MAG TPA: DUF4124 domain-containing protein [Methylotenera sp.]|nr:DUF4124 domain-containing protein [Methylotenera sp.]